MPSEIREFLEVVKPEVANMDKTELSNEVEGWRTVFALLPNECLEWMARLHEIIRFTKRNYQGGAGVLLGFRMAPTEFTIGLQEVGMDSLSGSRIVENKTLTIPEAAVMFYECIDDVQPFNLEQREAEIAAQSV